MGETETDYLVVGAGASGMAFVDALVGGGDADVVVVDRRHSPGGHWLDAYPFVRLHQPVGELRRELTVLGHDRIDETGPNAGFYGARPQRSATTTGRSSTRPSCRPTGCASSG